jgi:hypothetical protein
MVFTPQLQPIGLRHGRHHYPDGDDPIPYPYLTTGTVYYVNGTSGNNANSGLLPSAPLLTIAAALAKCVDDNDDYIIVEDCWSEAFPIVVNKERVHIIGLDMGVGWPQLQAAADTAIFVVQKDYMELAGFALQAPAQTAAHALIEFNTPGVGRANIHHNQFGELNVAFHAIRGGAAGAGANCWIHDNVFGSQLQGQGVGGTISAGRINDNTFHRGIAGQCIALSGVVAEILRNTFGNADTGVGYAITLTGQGVGIIDGNHAMTGNAAAANNPYKDTGVPKANWGINYRDITATLPA